jgi:hypothetical protein
MKTKAEYDQEAFEAGKLLGQKLADQLNCYSNKQTIAGFVEGCTHQHRSLQQSIMRAFFEVLRKWADDHVQGWYDPRNGNTCDFAHRAVKMANDEHITFPLI